MTDDDYEEDTMKNKKFIALLAMTVALSGVMTACSFGTKRPRVRITSFRLSFRKFILYIK